VNAGSDDFAEDERLTRLATEWAQGDVEPAMASALTAAIERGDMEEIRLACARPLEFGTAGLRGEVGPGPARMNLSTIARVSFAVGEFLCERSSESPRVVVGFDARLDSLRFARHSAEILAGCGAEVLLAARALPTPVVAYATRKLKANAGIVITASHNPRADNGFKVFDDQGVQIVLPWDGQIAERMARAPQARGMIRDVDRVRELPPHVEADYFRDAARTAEAHVPERSPSRLVGLAYSPLHGVGLWAVVRALHAMGQEVDLRTVPLQSAPDGTFPTVPFPNPEEPGVLDLLLEEARKSNLDCAAANDPDADRLAVCLPLGSSRLVRLSGDALGLLFADACLDASSYERPVVVSTVVSSPALESLVEERGGELIRTLTGFKWICHAAVEREQFVFAYEEALGYCFAAPDGSVAAMDKDGVLALLVFTRLLAAAGSGAGLAERLLGIYRRFGLWGSFGYSRRWKGIEAASAMAGVLTRLRSDLPTALAGLAVVGSTDFLQGAHERPWYQGEQDLLQLELKRGKDDGGTVRRGRVLVRPSGTEPKLKVYVHLCSDFDQQDDYLSLQAEQIRLAEQIADELFEQG
jgi:phosphomannomutase